MRGSGILYQAWARFLGGPLIRRSTYTRVYMVIVAVITLFQLQCLFLMRLICLVLLKVVRSKQNIRIC